MLPHLRLNPPYEFFWNCIMTNVMHKFLIYLSIYFCLTCFGLSFSPSSEAGVQFRQWFKFAGYGVSARALTPYPADLNLCIKLVIIQFHSKMHGPYNIKFPIWLLPLDAWCLGCLLDWHQRCRGTYCLQFQTKCLQDYGAQVVQLEPHSKF
jgi:hypothetical protein